MPDHQRVSPQPLSDTAAAEPARAAVAGSEPDAVAARYARREPGDRRYHPLEPSVWRSRQERERALLQLLAAQGCSDLSQRRVLEVGCGDGANLLDCLRLGAAPEHLSGIELLPQRCRLARARLPAAVTLIEGDALQAVIEPASQDVVLQSTVFSSLLDDAFQQRLADAMWRWTKPGGAVLWYDFTVNNPRNADVRGVPLSRVRELFPRGSITTRRITLAPPISRLVCRLHPAAYGIFNTLPWLRTHVLCWIAKPRSAG
jgi:SAM-dependent methyltransferase